MKMIYEINEIMRFYNLVINYNIIKMYEPNGKLLVRNEKRSKLTSVYSGPYLVIRDLTPNERNTR